MFLCAGWFERLREERESRKESQTACGVHGGVKKQTQIAYEQGKSSPDLSYFNGLEAVGYDVKYILTGVRSASVAGTEDQPVPPRKKAMIDLFDDLDEEGQREIREAIEKEKRRSEARRRLAELERKVG